jgi:hypothetical protein
MTEKYYLIDNSRVDLVQLDVQIFLTSPLVMIPKVMRLAGHVFYKTISSMVRESISI